MNQPLAPGATIGIVGGGQLGRMLAMAAARLGYHTIILEPDRTCPAAEVAGHHIVASYDDGRALEQLARRSDVVTYEFENVPVMSARSLADRVPLHPPAEALEAAQDRLSEKIFLNAIGIATAPFVSVGTDEELAEGLARFSGSGVLKTRRFGYDGKGQRVFRRAGAGDAKGAVTAMGSVPLILEGLVPFEREISVIAARGLDGKLAAYEPAENIHRDGILFQSTVPAAISAETAEAAARWPMPSFPHSIMSASSGSNSLCSGTDRCSSTRWRPASTIPATGPKRPAPSLNSSSTSAPFPDCHWAARNVTRTARWKISSAPTRSGHRNCSPNPI